MEPRIADALDVEADRGLEAGGRLNRCEPSGASRSRTGSCLPSQNLRAGNPRGGDVVAQERQEIAEDR